MPTPPELVETMLDMARVTCTDVVLDLGSGDGRIVIAAAKRGARGIGVEYDLGLIAASRRNASLAGVDRRARFIRGDLYHAYVREATVLALFLLPNTLNALKPLLRAAKPGTRIVTNRYGIDGWEPLEVRRIGGHSESCCTALLYIVPAELPAGA